MKEILNERERKEYRAPFIEIVAPFAGDYLLVSESGVSARLDDGTVIGDGGDDDDDDNGWPTPAAKPFFDD